MDNSFFEQERRKENTRNRNINESKPNIQIKWRGFFCMGFDKSIKNMIKYDHLIYHPDGSPEGQGCDNFYGEYQFSGHTSNITKKVTLCKNYYREGISINEEGYWKNNRICGKWNMFNMEGYLEGGVDWESMGHIILSYQVENEPEEVEMNFLNLKETQIDLDSALEGGDDDTLKACYDGEYVGLCKIYSIGGTEEEGGYTAYGEIDLNKQKISFRKYLHCRDRMIQFEGYYEKPQVIRSMITLPALGRIIRKVTGRWFVEGEDNGCFSGVIRGDLVDFCEGVSVNDLLGGMDVSNDLNGKEEDGVERSVGFQNIHFPAERKNSGGKARNKIKLSQL